MVIDYKDFSDALYYRIRVQGMNDRDEFYMEKLHEWIMTEIAKATELF